MTLYSLPPIEKHGARIVFTHSVLKSLSLFLCCGLSLALSAEAALCILPVQHGRVGLQPTILRAHGRLLRTSAPVEVEHRERAVDRGVVIVLQDELSYR